MLFQTLVMRAESLCVLQSISTQRILTDTIIALKGTHQASPSAADAMEAHGA